tara:strand:+ start:59 stop:277 length:219 start_codon:yes stop_codon:yes gene_type:complete
MEDHNLPESIDIDGVTYYTDEMEGNQRLILMAIGQCDVELNRAKHMMAICQTARQAYINDLGTQLKEDAEKS